MIESPGDPPFEEETPAVRMRANPWQNLVGLAAELEMSASQMDRERSGHIVAAIEAQFRRAVAEDMRRGEIIT